MINFMGKKSDSRVAKIYCLKCPVFSEVYCKTYTNKNVCPIFRKKKSNQEKLSPSVPRQWIYKDFKAAIVNISKERNETVFK